MQLHIAQVVGIDEAAMHVTSPMIKKSKDAIASNLMEEFASNMKNHIHEYEATKVTPINDPKAIRHFRNGSVYMTYQLIQTTPQVKKNLLKYADTHKTTMIKDMDNTEYMPSLNEILRKTPANLKDETRAIAQILTLATQETTQSERPYTDALLNAILPLRKWVETHEKYIRQKLDYHEVISDILYSEGLDITNKEVQHIMKQNGMETADAGFIDFVKKESLKELQRLSEEDFEVPPYSYHDIIREAKRLDNNDDQKREVTHEKDSEPFKYTVRDMYFIGSLIFLDEYLELLPGSAYIFGSNSELSAYIRHSNTIYAMYGSGKVIDKVKSTKTKERPLRVANKESFGNMVQFALNKDDSRKWTAFLSHLYTQIDLRSDILWNTLLSKRDIDTVAQLVKQWNTLTNKTEQMSNEDQPIFFLIGLMITALEKQQKESDDYINETIIRMDEEQERVLTNTITQKEQKIKQLMATIDTQNKSLTQLESLRQKNLRLEEQLAWQEQQLKQDESLFESIDANDTSVDIDIIRERLNQEDVCFMGGDINWQNAMKQDLPLATFQLAEESGRSMRHVERCKIIVYNTATMNHGIFYRFKAGLKRNTNDPVIIYLNTQGSNKSLTYQRIGSELLKLESEVRL